MDTPNPSTERARPSTWFDEMLIRVRDIANTAARKRCRGDEAEDVAQDIVLSFLEKFHAGCITEPPAHVAKLVTYLVHQRLVDRERRADARTRRETEFVDRLVLNQPEWMRPDDAHDASELGDLHTRLIAELPETRRKAYVLVREDARTYKLAAKHLGITPLAICAHVVSAQKYFRRRLASEGVVYRPRRLGHGRP